MKRAGRGASAKKNFILAASSAATILRTEKEEEHTCSASPLNRFPRETRLLDLLQDLSTSFPIEGWSLDFDQEREKELSSFLRSFFFSMALSAVLPSFRRGRRSRAARAALIVLVLALASALVAAG